MLGGKNTVDLHAWVEERLSDYIDNQVAPAERARLEQHLRECERCQASLASLSWTRALLKQAPAPRLPRTFVLSTQTTRDLRPVPPQRQRAPAPAFAFVRFATALATLVLIAVIGVDMISQMGGMAAAPAPTMAPAAAKGFAAPTMIALGVQPSPTALAKGGAVPTEAPKPAEAAKETFPPAPTAAPQLAAPPPAPAGLPTAAPTHAPEVRGTAAAEIPAPTKAAADSAPKSIVATPSAPRSAVGNASAVTATVTIPAPTAERELKPTLTPTPTETIAPTASPLPTQIAQARAEPTRAPQPTPVPVAVSQPVATPLRIAEFGLLFLVVFFGVLTTLMWRRK